MSDDDGGDVEASFELHEHAPDAALFEHVKQPACGYGYYCGVAHVRQGQQSLFRHTPQIHMQLLTY